MVSPCGLGSGSAQRDSSDTSGPRALKPRTTSARARELILESGALTATLDLAGDYAGKAKAALSRFPVGPWRSALDALADFAVSRGA